MSAASLDVIPRKEPLRILIPLNGSDDDTSALTVASEIAARNVEVFLLLARSGPDEEQYPDLREGVSETERIERYIESRRIFARANAILASRGLISAGQLAAQGKPAEIILRVAKQITAELIVLAANDAQDVIEQATSAVVVARPRTASKLTIDKIAINQLPFEKLRGKHVFIRIDADAEDSSSGILFDESKLRSSLPTFEYLTQVGARIIIGTHLDNPKGRVVESLRLDPVAKRLSELLGRPVRKLGDAIGRDVWHAVADMRDGDLLLLENLRFYPGEDANEAEFAHELAKLCNIYCNDSFALAHRASASTVGITRHVRPAASGLALARELMMFEAVLEKPELPFVGLIAGARLEKKLPILENLLPRLNRLFIGGALSFTFLKAKRREIGAVPVDEAFLPLVKDFLKKAEKKEVEIILPEDFIAVEADEFRTYEESGRQGWIPEWRLELENGIPPSYLPVDVGPSTVNRIKGLIEGARTIFWNGPLGIWEVEPFGAATRAVALLMAERVSGRHQRTILCGDSLARAIQSFNLPVEFVHHLTTGGESAFQLLAGNPLPAVSALDGEVDLVAPIETRPRHILLPVDGSEYALEVARRLGRLVDAEGARISLLHVHESNALVTDEPRIDSDTRQQREIWRRRDAERIFAAIEEPLVQQGLYSERQLMAEGDPADEILKSADEIGADLIAMGSHRRTGILRFLMGSVSRKVLDQAKCPVLIVRIPDRRMAEAGMLET